MRARLLSFMGLVVTGGGACTGETDVVARAENELVESSAPRAGGTIDSPSVIAAKRYWGARGIDVLEAAGADPLVVSVAKRADGILGNAPANGRVGVDELANLERASGTSFPEERAAIATLWKILAIDPVNVVEAPSPVLAKNVVESYAVAPTELPIAWLTALTEDDRTAAARVELTHDSDGNAATISGKDLAAAYAHESDYLREEVEAFRRIALAVAKGPSRSSPRLSADAQYVELPPNDSRPIHDGTLLTLSTRTEGFARAWSQVSPQSAFSLVSSVTVTEKDEQLRLVVLDRKTGEDRFSWGGPEVVSKPSRIEAWKDGVKVGELEVSFDESASTVTEHLPFGFSVKRADRWYRMSFDGPSGHYAPEVTSAPAVPSGAYFIAGTKDRLDVFPTGRAVLRADGEATRDCMPVERNGVVEGCRVLATNGAITSQFTFGPHRTTRLPAPIHGTMGATEVALYPF